MILKIRCFRSIQDCSIDLPPLTVVYGANGAGKSTLLYALLTLRNVILNPNQNTVGFFNYGFVNLGAFEAVVHDHRVEKNIHLGFALESHGWGVSYDVVVGSNSGNFTLKVSKKGTLSTLGGMTVSFPYPLNQTKTLAISEGDHKVALAWNGITTRVQKQTEDQPMAEHALRLAAIANAPVELLRKVAIIPLKRGFSKPSYSTVSVTPLGISEDEVATALSNDKYLTSRVSFYLEKILNRDLRVNFQPGTAMFSLDSTDRGTGIACELVNDGFGVNQIAFFLARCLSTDSQFVCVEEPEIHLHPTAVRSTARVLVEIMRQEQKRFVITTHSEPFLLALLSLIADGTLPPNEVGCYLAQKSGKATHFERATVNEKGQIKGGLREFMSGELEDLKTFLGIHE